MRGGSAAGPERGKPGDFDRACAREAATREILEVISQSRNDDRPVLDVILRNAIRLCQADTVALFLGRPDDARMTLAAWRNIDVTSEAATAATIASVNATDLPMDPTLHASARAILSGEVVHIVDGTLAKGYLSGDPAFRIMIDTLSVRTYLNVPLIDSEGALGVLTLHRSVVLAFSDDEIALIRSFAAQAVIAIENARQFRELQTRLAREAATREILEVISQSRDDDRPVFDVVLRNAAELCGAPLAGLNIISEDRSHAVMVAHWGDRLRALEPGKTIWPLDADLVPSIAMREGRIVQERDLADTDSYRAGDPVRRQSVDEEGIRTIVVVPLFNGGRTVGSIALFRREVQPFTPDEIALVETFAAQAVIAIENVRQFRELQTRLAREAATREILEVISQSRDDDRPVFDAVLRNAIHLCNATTAALFLGRKDDLRLTLAAWRDRASQSAVTDDAMIATVNATEMRMDPSVHLSAKAICEERVVNIDDAIQTAGYLSGELTYVVMAENLGVRSYVNVPLMDARGALGVVQLHRREVRPFTADEIALVETFAAQAVIAIENVRQFRELQTRLAREAATREILEVISQSRDDDKPVFDVVLRKAADLCNASMASLLLISEDRRQAVLVADWGLGQVSGLIQVGATVWPMESDYAPSACMREGRIVHIHDIADTDLYRSGDPLRVAAVEEDGIRTVLAVPLFSGGQTAGCIMVYRREVRPFTADEIALVETFAAQAVIAIENVRQFRELQDSLEQQEATSDILRVISQSREDDTQVFDLILEKAAVLCNADQGSLMIVNEARTHVRHMADWGHDRTAYLPGLEYSLDLPLSIVPTIRTAKVVHIEDYSQSDAYKDRDPIAVSLVETEGHRTRLIVPLLQNGIAIGCIALSRRAVRPFTPDGIALVETFAAQAVIAIENVRQFRELQTRLAREAATREILEVISRNPDDDRPVFDAILGNAIRLCGADTSALFLGRLDDQRLVLAAWRDRAASSSVMEDEMIAQTNATPMLMDPTVHVSAQAIIEECNIHIPDVQQHPSYLSGEPSYRIFGDALGIRSASVVPLIDARGALGVVQVHRREVRPFTDDEIALVETFAAQAVIAIENVRQYRELQDRLAREEATREILQVISQSRDDETPVFDAILERAERLCDAPSSALLLVNDARSHLVLVATRGMRSSADIGETHPITSGHTSSDAVLTGAIAHVPDVRDTELYRNGDPLRIELVEQWGLRTSLAVPLISNGEAIGAFTVMRLHNERPFSNNDIRLLEAFAAQAVIAIENVRQFKALEALNAELGGRVQDQVGEIERMGRLKRFLPAAVADAVVSSGSEKMLSSHRALLGVLFCDIRGFTAFCETAEPEETIEVLQTYHEEMGKLINAHGAGVDHRMGDGIMVLFNDPLPCEDPAGDAVRLAMAMRTRMAELAQHWKRLGHRLGFGVGVSLGYATVGMVGFEGRFDYTASGTAINLASRLCDEALDGEILLSPRASIAVENRFAVDSRGEMTLKGIREPIEVFRLIRAVHG